MDDADRLNAQAATLYAAVYWLGVIVAAAMSNNHAAVVIGLIGVVLGFLASGAAYGQPRSFVAVGISVACNVVALIAAAALLIGYAS